MRCGQRGRGGRGKKTEQKKDRHVTDAKRMREDFTPGRHTGKEGCKRGEGSDPDTERWRYKA